MYQENIAYLRQFMPELLDELAPLRPEMCLIPSRKSGLTLLMQGEPVHSKYDPEKESAKIVGEERAKLHLHFGFGLGYWARADQTIQGGQILVYEPDASILMAALLHIALVPLFESRIIRIFCRLDRFEIAVAEALGQEPAKLVASPFHKQAYPNSFVHFENAHKKARLTQESLQRTIHNRGPLFTEAALKAFPDSFSLAGVDQLSGLFAQTPAIIVSAGASLQRNLSDLFPYRDHCLIFSLARTASLLESLSIEPHFLVHNEMGSFYSTIEACSNLEHTTFLLCDHAEPAFFKRAAGRAFCYRMRGNYGAAWLEAQFPWFKNPSIPSGGSVANEAFSLALLAGCNPIILIGQDLGWEGNHFYAAPEVNLNPIYQSNTVCSLPGYFGSPIQTYSSYFSYLQWFVGRASALKKEQPERILINATEGGATIAGFQQLSLRDAAHRYLSKPLGFDLSARLSKAVPERPAWAVAQAQLRQRLGECQALKAQLETAQVLTKWLLAHLDGQQEGRAFQKRAEKLNRCCESYQEMLAKLTLLNGFMEKPLWEINQRPAPLVNPARNAAEAQQEQTRFGLQMLHDIQAVSLSATEQTLYLLARITTPSATAASL